MELRKRGESVYLAAWTRRVGGSATATALQGMLLYIRVRKKNREEEYSLAGELAYAY
jgi:hypothetical protein